MAPYTVRGLGVCLAYMVVGPLLMLTNKTIMDKSGLNFPYPFVLSSLGLVCTTATTRLLHQLGRLRLPNRAVVTPKFIVQNVLPVGACHAASLCCSNAQYLWLSVSTIQFLKAFTPIVVTAFSWMLLRKSVSRQVWAALSVACVGTSLTAVGDVHLHLFGLVLAAGASCSEAVRLVLTQFALQDCKFTLLEGQYFLAPAGAGCLIVLTLVFEGPSLWRTGDLMKIVQHPLRFSLAGSLGFGVQILTARVIQQTNSITVKVLSQFRNAIVVFAGVAVYHEVVTLQQFIGYVMSVAGILAYSYLRALRSQPTARTHRSTSVKTWVQVV